MFRSVPHTLAAGVFAALGTVHSAAIAQSAPPPTAEQTPPEDLSERQLRIDAYAWIWLVGFNGDIGVRGRTAGVDSSFGDVLDASDSIFAFSGRLEIGSGRIAAFLDGMYSDLGADDQSGPEGVASIDVTLQQALLDFGLMYRLVDREPEGDAAANRKNITLDLYAGGRFNSMEIDLDAQNGERRSASKDWIDPIVGAKLGLPFSERWRAEINGDIGGFGASSDFTWSATAVLGFDFDLFGLPSTAFAGYRAIGWDYSEGSGAEEFIFDMTQHGPLLGLSLSF